MSLVLTLPSASLPSLPRALHSGDGALTGVAVADLPALAAALRASGSSLRAALSSAGPDMGLVVCPSAPPLLDAVFPPEEAAPSAPKCVHFLECAIVCVGCSLTVSV